MATWFYDCDYGQGTVEARTEEAARKQAVKEAGTMAQVCNVRRPTQSERAFRKAMGGA